jgi:hypothetical protein
MLRPRHSPASRGKRNYTPPLYSGISVPGNSKPSPEEAAQDQPSNPGFKEES